MTKRLKVGTGICLVIQHDPIVAAKAVASLDLLSNGRFLFGVGAGWNAEEMEDHGVPYADRRDVAREHLLAMRALWRDEVASFDGTHTRFEPSWSWPKPVSGGPPVYIGGAAGPKLFAHVAEYADGWIPIGGAGLKQALPELRRAWEERGRDPKALHVVPMGVLPDEAKLDYYASLGVTEAVLRLPSAPRDQVMPVLDAYARFASD